MNAWIECWGKEWLVNLRTTHGWMNDQSNRWISEWSIIKWRNEWMSRAKSEKIQWWIDERMNE